MKPTSIGFALLWPLRILRDYQVNLLAVASIGAVWFAAWTRSVDLSAPGVRFSLPGLPPPNIVASDHRRSEQSVYPIKHSLLETADTSDHGS